MPNECRVDNKALPWLKRYRVATWLVGDNTLFEWTDADFDRQAWAFKQHGYTAVDPSGFHFRWSWMESDKENLMRQTRRIVEASHRHGLKYIEHHSVTLMNRPINEEKIAEFLTTEWKNLRVDFKRHPLFVAGLRRGVIYQGKNIDEFVQTDLATGKPARTGRYNGVAICFNNPEFRNLYFRYLEELYELGIDGILPDDVHFYPNTNSCGCSYCRDKFKHSTGYVLPDFPETVGEFLGNYEDPVYRAWIQFRVDATVEFHREVTRHFRNLGKNLARPIYSSADTMFQSTIRAYSIERIAPYCSLVFTEVYYPIILPHSWERIGVEALHRLAIGRRYHMPVQILFYPLDTEAGSFCIAFANLLGMGYLGSTYHAEPGRPKTSFDRVFDLTKKQADLFEMPESMSRIKVFFSRISRDAYRGHNDRHSTWEWAGWCELLLRERIPFDVILHDDLEEDGWMKNTSLLILPNSACMNKSQIDRIRRFVAKGGKIIATYETSLYDTQGAVLKDFQLADLFGLKFIRTETRIHPSFLLKPEIFSNVSESYIENTEPVVLTRMLPGTTMLAKLVFAETEELELREYPAIIRNHFGKGEVVVFLGKPGNQNYASFILKEYRNVEIPWRCFGQRNFPLRQIMLEIIRGMIKNDEDLVVEGAPDGVLVTCHKTKSHMVVHLLNATGCIVEPGTVFKNGYPKTIFPATTAKIKVQIRAKVSSTALAFSPERQKPIEIAVRQEHNMAWFNIPKGMLNRYLVIALPKK